jgi:SAM-dependent methyltransferase
MAARHRAGPASRAVVFALRSRLRESTLLRGLRLKLRDQIRSEPPRWEATRDDLAFRYLRGHGIEIGALYRPQRAPPGVNVTYVDHAATDELRRSYPEHDWIRPPDVVDEAERLTSFGDDSLDFVMANHVLEHVEDPIAALSTFLRVLRPGGVLFLTLPDPRRSFDGPRERTSVEHVLRDHREGADVSRSAHYLEYVRLVEGVTGDDLARRSAELAAQGSRIHFHVWEPDGFLELLLALQLPIDIEAVQATGIEFTVVLRKNPDKRR